MTVHPPVTVVGAGPAGLAAASAATAAGARVRLIDAEPSPGGQYLRGDALGRAYDGAKVHGARVPDGVDYLPDTEVWALEPLPGGGARLHLRTGPADGSGGAVGAGRADPVGRPGPSTGRTTGEPDAAPPSGTTADDRPGPMGVRSAPSTRPRADDGRAAPLEATSTVAVHTVDAPVLVLATGAHDRVLPFPGWDLPGVVTAGAAQALAKSQRTAIGHNAVVAGTGPFLLPVARSLHGVGARVAAVLEAGAPVSGWLGDPGGAAAGLGKLGELAGHTAALARRRVPYRTRTAVIEAHGDGALEAVTTARLDPRWRPLPGTERTIAADALCLGFGFTPRLEAAIAAGCATSGGFVRVDAAQATSARGVFAAGEPTGIGGAALAAAEGEVAGTAAARAAGHPVAPPLGALRRVRTGRRFAAGLAAAHPIGPGWKEWPRDDTLVCRCEEVALRDLHAAARSAPGGRAFRLASRAGLGLCQGRVCGRNTAELIGLTDEDARRFDRRPIAVPIRLGDLADDT
ncbi:FAD-dependent oxidoreductase [Nocardiopsis chromatogenes]|uniref:FAD-dependent oxidoreductase n=1 Tax=Nocardiopsis chromatogenes TaxID=280239 RepID=UPI0003461945|nr:FAD-dependent oxidoreductase [Nocardiopsis chromatogenes]